MTRLPEHDPSEAFPWPSDADTGKGQDSEGVDAGSDPGRMSRRAGESRRLCALCARPFDHDDTRPAPFFPFCSSRCRAVDLGNWVNGAYVVGGVPGTAELSELEPPRRRGLAAEVDSVLDEDRASPEDDSTQVDDSTHDD